MAARLLFVSIRRADYIGHKPLIASSEPMRRQSDALLLLPLLPIFLVGLFPMLMLALLGFAGLGLLGILLICAA